MQSQAGAARGFAVFILAITLALCAAGTLSAEEAAEPAAEQAAPSEAAEAAAPDTPAQEPALQEAPVPPTEQSVVFSGWIRDELSSQLPADTSAALMAGNRLWIRSVVELAPSKAARAHLDAEGGLTGLSSSLDSTLLENLDGWLNEAWLRADLSQSLVFLAGKRRMAWGTGFFHNPTDFINPPKDPTQPEEQRQGVWSAHLGLYLSAFSFEQAAIIYDKLSSTGYAAKLATSALIPGVDLNLVFFYADPEGFNTGGSFDANIFSGVPILSGLSFHGEFAAREHSKLDPAWNGWATGALGGLRLQAPVTDTYIVAEYLYQQDGLESLPAPPAPGYPPLFDRGSAYRHNLAFSVTQPNLTTRVSAFTDSLSAQATVLVNPMDGSTLLRAGLGSSYVENCTINLDATWYLGPESTEFGSLRTGSAGTLGSIQLTVEVGF